MYFIVVIEIRWALFNRELLSHHLVSPTKASCKFIVPFFYRLPRIAGLSTLHLYFILLVALTSIIRRIKLLVLLILISLYYLHVLLELS